MWERAALAPSARRSGTEECHKWTQNAYTGSPYAEAVASRQGRPGVHETPGVETHRWSDRSSAGTRVPSTDQRGSRTPEDPPIRDPRLYAQTDHFRERLHQPGRYVSLPIVAEAIERGQLRWNSADGWRFALVRDGVRFVVVVSDTETPSPVIVTGWTEIDSWATAMASDRWSAVDVHTIELRTDLSDNHDEQIPSLIRPRTVDRPFRIGNHRVVTDAGRSHVECADCGGHFRSKAALSTCHCNG